LSGAAMRDSVGGFDWDAGNREKCRKHGVALDDIEALFRGRVAIHPGRVAIREERFIAIGTTSQSRKVLVVFTFRTRHGRTLIRPISARYMHKQEVRHYEEEASKTEE
jgi:hypothetical protein